jgi:hypothetical protein
MRIVSLSIGSWLTALGALLSTFYIAEGANLSVAEGRGAMEISLMVVALLFALAYAPSLFWLRQRLGGCRPTLAFPLTTALVLNLPVFLIDFFAIGRTLLAVEAFAAIGSFVLMGVVFGCSFVWSYGDSAV